MPRSHDKSVKLSRTRSNSLTRRNSTSSNASRGNLYLDENDTEIFSGVGSEIVPSSIVTFHHLHNFEDSSSEDENDEVAPIQEEETEYAIATQDDSRSAKNANTSHSSGKHHQHHNHNHNHHQHQQNLSEDGQMRNSLVLNKMDSNISVRSRNNSLESNARPNFKFFTSDEIENAQGVSSTLDDPLVDYDTDWNVGPTYINIDKDDTAQLIAAGEFQGPDASIDARRYSQHADTTTTSESNDNDPYRGEATYRTRLLSDASEHENYVILDIDSNASVHHTTPKKIIHNQNFFPNSKVHFQRFYIAEEDLIIGIAGYKTSKIGLFCFYLINILTLGISYLILRWLPRYRINLYGKRENLGNCDWVVIENEYGELDIIEIDKEWFNRDLSTVFNLKTKKSNNDDAIVDSLDEDVKIPVILSFEYRYLKLIYNPIEDIYTTNTNWVDKSHWSSTHKIRHGLHEYDIEDRKLVFGNNSLDLKESSIGELLVKEVLHPFYIFQIFSIILWLLDDYFYYAFCIFFISIVSIVQSLIETKQTMQKLKEISKLNNYPYVRIKRNGFWKEVLLEELVPGDLYELSDPNLSSIPCDSVLISGDCIINESMLTGESVPVSKVPITDECLKKNLVNVDSPFVTKNQISGSLSKSYLFSGTKIIRVRRSQGNGNDTNDVSSMNSSNTSINNEPALALVVKIGFSTTKGQLLRSMLFPKPTGFKFYKDAFKYIGFMGLVAACGFVYSIHNFLKLELSTSIIVLRAFDIITIVVPPALPATLTIGTNFAVNRLKNSKIFCISPSKVNIGGKVDVFCFDKTGTLTEDGLDILGIHIVQQSFERNIKEFGGLTRDLNCILKGYNDLSDFFNSPTPILTSKNNNKKKKNKNGNKRIEDAKAKNSEALYNFLASLCTCHSLRVVDDEYVGDPLDYKMFEFTKWDIQEDYEYVVSDRKTVYPIVAKPSLDSNITSENEDNFIAIVKSFEFVPQLRRMSVIAKSLNKEDKLNLSGYQVFTKGAPEVISELCLPESLPENYEDLLYRYTHDGYRVIAMATKKLSNNTNSTLKQVNSLSRSFIESELEFLGFIIFENRLKEQTKPTLEILNQEAGIRTIMCTGDNILTAISVAKESNLISNHSAHIFIPRFSNESLDSASGSYSNNDLDIMWEDVNDPEIVLDSQTLTPIVKDNDNNGFTSTTDYKLAITGDIFRYILKTEEQQQEQDEVHSKFSQEYIERLLMYTNIYARMSPDEKHELVEQLQKIDYTVGFCGDGANDCGALKAADVGISLSEAEASVAAPFTSTNFEISCVLNIIKEGRASLVTSFSCFKYMSLYSAIQFISVSILYKKGSNLGDFQFLWIDLFLILPIAIFMSWSKPYHSIVKKKPSANLVSSKVLIPLVGNIGILLLFQIFVWKAVQTEPWYIHPVPGGDDAVQSSDNTVLFFFSNLQYILIAIILTQGPPYRESSIKNLPFVTDIALSIGFSWLLMLVSPDSWLGNLMQLTYLSSGFKFFLTIISVLNLVVLWFGDKYLFLKFNRLFIRLVYGPRRKSKKFFKRLIRQYEESYTV